MTKAKRTSLIKFYQLNPVGLRHRDHLQDFIANLFIEENRSLVSLDYIFCDDSYLQDINKEHLDHDDLTDIITFDLSEQETLLVGEIYISIERVRENAGIFKTDYLDELRRVMFHGALHLCGYNDKSPSEQEQMRAKENYYLGKYHTSRR